MNEPSILRQFLQHRDSLLAFIYALTRDHDAAEEVFQEVGLAITSEARRSTEVKNFPAWAREIARRRVSAYFRENHRRKSMVPWSESFADVVEQAFSENEKTLEHQQLRYRFLHQCLETLVGRSRQVIEQRYGEGKRNSAIAKNLGWKPESVKVALSRARKQLAKCIETKLRAAGVL